MKFLRFKTFLFLQLLMAALFLCASVSAEITAKGTGLDKPDISAPDLVISGVDFSIVIQSPNEILPLDIIIQGKECRNFQSKQTDSVLTLSKIQIDNPGYSTLIIRQLGTEIYRKEIFVIPGFLSLLPPLLAIILALLFRQVIIALTIGVWLGATIATGFDPLSGLFATVTHYIKNSLTDPDRAAILLFTTLLGGMIGVISRSGGTLGVVKSLRNFANTPKRAQLATWLMGIFIFFDDYSNTLIVGNTMRPISDKLKISREKLSYIVDSTAAPVTSIAVITTWVGFQISLIANSFDTLDLKYSPFVTFVQSVPYQFYSILALFFVFLVIFSGRDFGPMYKAELRARKEGKVLSDDAIPMSDFSPETQAPPENAPHRWYNAVIPIMFVIFATFAGLIIDGRRALESKGVDLSDKSFLSGLKEVFSAADSFQILMIVSFLGCIVAILLAIGQKILSLAQSMEALVTGLKSMLMAVIILILAGAIGDICADLKTADYISSVLSGGISIHLLPAATFLVAALISFSTGTSWGTMSILTPLVIPLTFKMGEALALSTSESFNILLLTIASIMGGAVFGDHSSPISDTTIMSSISCGSDHIHHVKTQFPYASLTAIVSITICLVPASFLNISPLISIPTAAFCLFLFLRFRGKKVD